MGEQTGGCQCGKVRYGIRAQPVAIYACHCKECQRQSGSAFGMSMTVKREDFTLVGELKSFERDTDAGRRLRCYFCPECGTRVYHEPAYAPGYVNIKPGTLDDTSWLKPAAHVWTRSRQRWLELPADVPHFEAEP